MKAEHSLHLVRSDGTLPKDANDTGPNVHDRRSDGAGRCAIEDVGEAEVDEFLHLPARLESQLAQYPLRGDRRDAPMEVR